MVPWCQIVLRREKIKILYISYDGMTDALGQSQVISYLKRHSKELFQIDIVSFEKKEAYDLRKSVVEQAIKDTAIIWHPLFYTKKPPVLSTLKDIYCGLRKAQSICLGQAYHIVHCRGYISSFIGMSLQKKFGLKFIFDMRGWLPDEKKESGHWDSPLYKPVYTYLKKQEKKFFRKSDFIVSLTFAGKEEIVRNNWAQAEKIGVIPTCVDFSVFKPYDPLIRRQIRATLSISEQARIMVYSGALGGNYDTGDLVTLFLKYLRLYPDACLLVLSKDNPIQLKEAFKTIDPSHYRIKSVEFREVYKYLIASDIGVVFYKKEFSTIGRSPTKLGEYWAGGVPVISYAGIGDLDMIMGRYPEGGGLVNSFADQDTEQLLMKQWISKPDRELLRQYSKDYFDIEKGCRFYRNVYEQLVFGETTSAVG